MKLAAVALGIMVAACALAVWRELDRPKPDHVSFTMARPHCKLHVDTIDCTIKRLPKEQK